jgi:hypothetical protein
MVIAYAGRLGMLLRPELGYWRIPIWLASRRSSTASSSGRDRRGRRGLMFLRFRIESNHARPQSSLPAPRWDIANGLQLVGIAVGLYGLGRIADEHPLIQECGVSLLFAGTGLRWTAIRTLGNLFTGHVLI